MLEHVPHRDEIEMVVRKREELRLCRAGPHVETKRLACMLREFCRHLDAMDLPSALTQREQVGRPATADLQGTSCGCRARDAAPGDHVRAHLHQSAWPVVHVVTDECVVFVRVVSAQLCGGGARVEIRKTTSPTPHDLKRVAELHQAVPSENDPALVARAAEVARNLLHQHTVR